MFCYCLAPLCLMHRNLHFSNNFSNLQIAAGKNQPWQSVTPILRGELLVSSNVFMWGILWASLREAIKWQLLLLYLCFSEPWAQGSSPRIQVYSDLEKSYFFSNLKEVTEALIMVNFRQQRIGIIFLPSPLCTSLCCSPNCPSTSIPPTPNDPHIL